MKSWKIHMKVGEIERNGLVNKINEKMRQANETKEGDNRNEGMGKLKVMKEWKKECRKEKIKTNEWMKEKIKENVNCERNDGRRI